MLHRRPFSILKEIKDDKNFKAYLSKFYELKKKCESQTEIEALVKEDDYGNVEYKLKLANPSIERVEHLTTQMKFRLEVRRNNSPQGFWERIFLIFIDIS